jgi:hypothetical protein
VGRFEREDIDATRLPAPLGTATEDLRATVESEVAKIVQDAEARAAEIENRALAKAIRIEEDWGRRAREVREHSRKRITHMLTEVDAFERGVDEALRSLRAEAERLVGELGKAGELSKAASEPSEPTPPPVPAQVAGDATEAREADEVEPDSGNSETPVTDFAAPEIREMIRQQLQGMSESGSTRADAERMLMRFKQGSQYFDLLDEFYPEETPGRGGLLRRRKAPPAES